MKFNCAYTDLVETHKIVENPRNPNKHPDKQIAMLAKIIDYLGQRSPIVVSNRSKFLIKGHGRLEAIQKLGWEKVAVDYQDYESEAQEFQDMIADNKIAELAEHDDAFMMDGIKDLKLVDIDFELLGIDDFRFASLDEEIDDDDEKKESENKEFQLKATFPNDMEMMEVHDTLLSRGFMVTIL